MSDSHISLGEDTQLLIVEDLDVDVDVEASGSDYLMPSSSLVGPFPNTNCSPPPLIGLDKPGPPNVALMNQSSTSRLSRSNSSSSSPALECAQSPTSCSSAAYITAVKSTYHKQLKKAYRMSPPSMAPLWPGLLASQLRHGSKTLADLSSPDLPDVDLDKMYLDVVTEDYKTAIKSLLPQLSISKMDPLSQVFCLRWNNHRNNLLNVLDNLLQTEAFCDVTLACDNTSIKCHKMILSACSAYFQKLFFEHPCDHPIVFLKDIKYAEIRAILDYMYKGEVNVAQEELPGLLKVAELLRVKGLVEEEREKLLNSNFIPGGGGSRGEGSGGKSHNSRSNEEPERSAKVNGGGTDHPSRNSVLAELRERERDRDRDRDRDRERERERERHRERVRSADAAVTKDSPPSTSTPVVPPMVRPFMYTPPPGAPSFPMFPIPGMFPGAQHLFGGSENDKDDSVGSHGAKRKKVASGSGGSSSSKESSGIGNNIKMDRDEHTGPNDLRVMDDKNQGNLSDSEKDSFMGLDKSGIANYVPNQRLEWKRYKQYTRNDIMAAIEEVKQGMSALQASRKYGVPSRTLYDKVKKMGITTGRQMQKKSLPNYPASFPQLGMLGMHESFKDADDREDTNDSSLGVPGDVTDGRATMVPPSGFSIQMLNLMKEMKDSNKSDLPINLSTMLSGVSSRDHNKRHSESSLSPRSPRGHYVGPEDEDEDIDDIDDDDQDREDGVDSSVRRRSRHSSGEIRAQFMADLKRLGGHIPYRAGSRGGSGDEPASSTTVSPPPTNTRLPVPPPLLHVPGEDSLPPRKRKVSQEHQLQQTPDDLTCSSTPYNGIHGNRNATNGGKGNESESSGMSSPEKQERMKDEPLSSPSLPCRN